jgi:hypothetical protein
MVRFDETCCRHTKSIKTNKNNMFSLMAYFFYFIHYHNGVFKIKVTTNSFLCHPPRGNIKTHVKTTVVCVAVCTEKDDHLEGKIGTVILAA